MTCGEGMPIIFEQTRQEKIEVVDWISGEGPATQAVHEAVERQGLTFAGALITREHSSLEEVRRN